MRGSPGLYTLLFIVTSILLSGCAHVPPPGAVIPIQWVRLDTQAEVDKACRAESDALNGVPSKRLVLPRTLYVPNESVLACYKELANGTCQIITLKMQSPYGAERRVIEQIDGKLFNLMGHEVAHCFIGDFHVENK